MRKRYLQLTSWEQLNETAENYRSAVANAQLVEPIGELHALTFGKCGLRNCKQPQKNSLLVSLKRGGYTNIGFDCGATHFPHLWADLKRRGKIYRDQETALVSLETLFEKLPDLEDTYATVLARCCRPIALMTSFRQEIPAPVLAELARRAANGDDVVEHSTHTYLGRLNHGTVGALKGLTSFRAGRDICAASSHASEILRRLKEIKKNGFDATAKELVALRKQINRDADFLPSLMRTIEDTSVIADSFFTQKNLDLIPFLQSAERSGISSVALVEKRKSIKVTFERRKRNSA